MGQPNLPRQCRRSKRHGGQPKKAYRTEAEAQADSGVGRFGAEIYCCGHCGNYHIGRPPRKPKTRLRAALRALRRKRDD